MKPKGSKNAKIANSTASALNIDVLTQLEEHFQHISPIRPPKTEGKISKSTKNTPQVASDHGNETLEGETHSSDLEKSNTDDPGSGEKVPKVTDDHEISKSKPDTTVSEKIKAVRNSPEGRSSVRGAGETGTNVITDYFTSANAEVTTTSSKTAKTASEKETANSARKRPADAEPNHANQQLECENDDIELHLWHGGGKKRKVDEVIDLDVLINELDDVAAGIKCETSEKSSRKALDRFMGRMHRDIYRMIETVQTTKKLQLSVNKGSTSLKQQRRELLELRQEVIKNAEVVDKLKKKKFDLEKKISNHKKLNDISAWLHTLEPAK